MDLKAVQIDIISKDRQNTFKKEVGIIFLGATEDVVKSSIDYLRFITMEVLKTSLQW